MSKSLAEHLGTQSPLASDVPLPEGPGDLSGKDFATLVVNSAEFRSYIVNSLVLGTTPAVIICRLMDQAWGKPVTPVEVDDKRTSTLSKRELEARIALLRNAVLDLPDDGEPKDDAPSIH